MLHKLIHPATQAWEAGLFSLSSLLSSLSTSSTLSLLLLLLATLEEVLPCTGYMEVGCVANLVRGGCNPAAAAAIAAALGLAVVRAMKELVAYTALLLSPPVPAWDASTIGKRAAAARVTAPARVAARMKVDVVKFPSTIGCRGHEQLAMEENQPSAAEGNVKRCSSSRRRR
jgi:hypothetical protein